MDDDVVQRALARILRMETVGLERASILREDFVTIPFRALIWDDSLFTVHFEYFWYDCLQDDEIEQSARIQTPTDIAQDNTMKSSG